MDFREKSTSGAGATPREPGVRARGRRKTDRGEETRAEGWGFSKGYPDSSRFVLCCFHENRWVARLLILQSRQTPPRNRVCDSMTKKSQLKSGKYCFLHSVQIVRAHPGCRTMMFGGHETTARTVSFSNHCTLRLSSTGSVAGVRSLGTCEESACPRETSRRDQGHAATNQVQGEG